jgi:NhaP-type Na+/H+ and K+/H+ antiporter
LGAFGDFIGGLLNPVVAFLAFLLLARSLRIQGYELSQATSAFKESAISQNEQAKLLRDSALTQYKLARIELVKLRIDAESKQIQSLVDFSLTRPIETKIYMFGDEITLKEALDNSTKWHLFHENEMCALLKEIGDIVGAYKK